MKAPAYDRMGRGYSDVRRADPRIEAAIRAALGDARTVLNVGAGSGSYEPRDREVIAVEPSPVMIAQRPAGAAPAIEGVAEALPLADKSVDATMGIFTMHHWDDVERGLAEVRRVTRERAVFLTLDLDVTAEMWLCRDYLPQIVEHDRRMFPTFEQLERLLPNLRFEPVPAPGDCSDGFCIALWSRPEEFLDPEVRRASSIWHVLPEAVAEPALERLRRDLESGEWDRRYGELRTRPALDIGLRLAIAELLVVSPPVTVDELRVADPPEAWAALGFAVEGDVCAVGDVRLRLAGRDAGRGLAGWSLRGVAAAELDGLPTTLSRRGPPAQAPRQPNGIAALDHVVAISPALERTVIALQDAGLDLRRVREEPTPAGAPRQAFFRLGATILEVVQEPPEAVERGGGGDRPAFFWGLAFLAPDLERTVAGLGDRVSEIRDAVQPGRRIATLRRSAGLALPVALITPP